MCPVYCFGKLDPTLRLGFDIPLTKPSYNSALKKKDKKSTVLKKLCLKINLNSHIYLFAYMFSGIGV